MMLYEAAEAAAEMRRESSLPSGPEDAGEINAPGAGETPAGEEPPGGEESLGSGIDGTARPAADSAGDGGTNALPSTAVVSGPIIRI